MLGRVSACQALSGRPLARAKQTNVSSLEVEPVAKGNGSIVSRGMQSFGELLLVKLILAGGVDSWNAPLWNAN